jgi:hypothetical protein
VLTPEPNRTESHRQPDDLHHRLVNVPPAAAISRALNNFTGNSLRPESRASGRTAQRLGSDATSQGPPTAPYSGLAQLNRQYNRFV